MKPKQELMSTAEVAHYLGLHLMTIHGWVKRGIVTPIRRGRKMFFHGRDIEKIREARLLLCRKAGADA